MRKLFSALAFAALMAGSINSESLWTDEAFSAFIASHRSVAACWATLVTGDSSDLQMALYYLYLHGWSVLFGQSEIAFRSANVPFILLYAGTLVWGSQRLFRSSWVWLLAGITPLAVLFASDTRPYFDEIALSLVCVTCVLAYLEAPGPRERRVLPWIVLLSVLIGALFHMLMLLVAPPLCVMLAVYYLSDRHSFYWPDWKKDWKAPLLTLMPVALVLVAYLAWTFGRGVTYGYARPDILSMASVFFRFAGLSGYSPNRRYDLPFRPYLVAMALSSAGFLSALIALFLAQPGNRLLTRAAQKLTHVFTATYRAATVRERSRQTGFQRPRCFYALAAALATAVVETSILSLVLRQQIEFRHLSSLLPLLMLLMMSGLSVDTAGARLFVRYAALALGLTWLGSDLRQLFAPEYHREAFRASVRRSIQLHLTTNAAIAVAADPVASAYYGLDVQGSQPCFPLTDSCAEGFAKVPWAKQARAEYALFWSAAEITKWLERQQLSQRPVVILISRSRHPTIKDSAWWPILAHQSRAQIFPEHGFFVYLLP